MKIFNEEDVNAVALDKYQYLMDGSLDSLFYPKVGSFVSGVEYAESKVEDLCIEFAEWILTNTDVDGLSYEHVFYYQGITYSSIELFELFLKERK